MWADVLTKPLQGQKFKDMRAFLQNCPRDYDDDNEKKLLMKPQDVASSRECVGAHARNPPAHPPSPKCVSWAEDVQTKKNKGSQPSNMRGKLRAK